MSTLPLYPDKFHLLVYIDERGSRKPIQTIAEWRKRRQHILAAMQQVMGDLPGEEKRVPLNPQVLEEQDCGKFLRRKIAFTPEQNDRLMAWLLIPKVLFNDTDKKAPAMLCLHQTTQIGKDEPAGLGGDPNLHYAKDLAEHGYVAFAPDYIGGDLPEVGIKEGFGESRTDPYDLGYVSGTMKGIWNHIRSIDFLQSLAFVDGNRIGVIGHSLGGYNALFLAAFDERVKAVICSCGFTSFIRYRGGDLTGWCHRGHMPRIAVVYNKDPAKLPFEFSEVLAAIAPRSLFINAPLHDDIFDVIGVGECIVAALAVYKLLGNGNGIVVHYPNEGHSFPPSVREAAYRWLGHIFSM
ncbi:MAG: alpha/beta hydrolase [Candidatus Fervidibacter sp.]|uniref:alpha/beta hydrolase n=1 Tax=Candidatus Fervidibacter sp. TaxID=3100871 RepID=UPI00404B9104